MKVTIFLCLVAFAAVLIQAKPHWEMPADMPADLKTKADQLQSQIEAWKKDNPDKSWRDIPEELKTQGRDIKQEYETNTGNKWPKHEHHHEGSGNDTSSAE